MQNDTSGTKNALRREMRSRRRSLSADERAEASRAVCRKLADLPEIAALSARSRGKARIAVYLASPAEIDLKDFIEAMSARGVGVVAPRWNGTAYEPAELKSLSPEDLRIGPMGIMEPADTDPVRPDEIDVWITPGLAFTADGKRLGYGGGWYDRLLAEADAGSLKIGVCHAFQLAEDIDTEPHDIRLDLVVTDADGN